MKKIFIYILLFVICLVGCDANMTSLPSQMPEDFSFSLTFGFDGFYDSKTGVLKNGYNYDLNCECQTTLFLCESQLREIYELFFSCYFDKYDEKVIVSEDLMDPSYDIKITCVAGGKTTNVTIYGASSITLDEWTNSGKLGKSYYTIVNEYIKSSEEYKSLPPNQKIYE